MSVLYPHPLQYRQIRLLRILPGCDPEPVRCNLIEQLLDQPQHFEALSYVWGDPAKQETILCNDQPVLVTVNLWTALRRIRDPKQSRLIWADAICINQSDVEERAQQVQLMRDVYTFATCVLAWLGPEDQNDNIPETLKLVEVIYRACNTYAHSIEIDVVVQARASNSFAPVSLDIIHREALGQGLGSGAWASLRKLFERTWFTRVWCVQEIALAKTSLVLIGQASIPWTHLGVCASWLEIQHSTNDFDVPAVLEAIPYFNCFCMFDKDDEEGLIQCLNRFRDFQATDPRDKVYGLLGIVALGENRELVEVNYRKSVIEVYTDICVATMRSERSLNILSFVKHRAGELENTKFPTWVPRWDISADSTMLDGFMGIWSASGERPLELPLKAEAGKISLRGCVIDTVEFCSASMDISLFKDSEEPSPPHPFIGFWRICSTHPHDRFSATIIMAYTLTASLNADYEVVPELEADDREQFVSDFLAYVDRLLRLSTSATDVANPLEMALKDGDWKRYKIAASRVCDQRRFFRSSRGHYGLGPACMTEGDVLVVLYGSGVPHVARRVGDDLLFVGECYMDEFMRGEALELSEPGCGASAERIFHFR